MCRPAARCCDGLVTERTRGGCAAACLAAAQLCAVALIFLSWWIGTYGSWDPQRVGPGVDSYVRKMGIVAVFAATAGAAAAARRAWRIVGIQAVVVGLVLTVMVGTQALGASEHRKQQRQACRAGLQSSACADART